ncbi:polymorphic toxin type 43 domain-containing protein [Streptomyces syringium]|uniref:polymorphic toxin type 43 domain-containing protein n=1 Tax=Streptomyces syringium TaxID=76729 RepID=UPI00339F3CF1
MPPWAWAGVLEVSDRAESVGAVKNFSPKGERDFIFNPATGRFATGTDQGVGGKAFQDFMGQRGITVSHTPGMHW